MICLSALVLAVASLASGSVLYHGPPAPLNHDGTVANTVEVEHAKAAHESAIAHEYHRLHETERLALAHPDLTSPHESYSHGLYSGSYTPSQYSQSSGHYYGQTAGYKYNPAAHVPAPLNHDGTVAQTPEYRAIAASHQAEYAKAVHNLKYQSYEPHFQHRASLGYAY